MNQLKIKNVYIYPIKSLRGFALDSTVLTPKGIPFDRSFVLLRDYKDGKAPNGTRFDHLAVGKYPSMCLFETTSVSFPTEDNPSGGEVEITHRDPEGGSTSTLKFPLQPDTDELDALEINMHSSPTQGYNMGAQYNDWFSKHFGIDLVLAYLGKNQRTVLGNIAPNAAVRNPKKIKKQQQSSNNASSWLSSITQTVLGSNGTSNEEDDDDDEDYYIGFADISPYLFISSTSVDDIASELQDGEMDHTKFRPNIVLEGAAEPYEEDFWSELTISSSSNDMVKIHLTANCCRCASLNVNYSTGKATGELLKKLQKSRRVDPGHPYSPVFGRYGFLTRDSEVVSGPLGAEISVGDSVEVTGRITERTVFKYPGIGKTKKEDIWAY